VQPDVLEWANQLTVLSYAFQPIVVARTGHCFGYEALLRGVDRLGFDTIRALFDRAYGERAMVTVERGLRELAMARFAAIPHNRSSRLFLNVDPRLFEMRDYRPSATTGLAEQYGINPESLCFEISEQTEPGLTAQSERCLDEYRRAGFQVAVDDFGVGVAGLKLLYDASPHFLKIDRSLISGIDREPRKRNLVDTVTRYAHALGVTVIAEGIETRGEFLVCRDLGCDLVQGFLISRPSTEIETLRPHYETVIDLNRSDRRFSTSDERLLETMIEPLEPLSSTVSMSAVLDYFWRHPEIALAPVVDPGGHPTGILRDRDLKIYVYSRYGADLLKNQAMGKNLRSFLRPCLATDIQSKAERVIELFSSNDAEDGVIVTRDGVYVGFLSAPALIKLAHEKNVVAARDQNPLSRLPGNTKIIEFISEALLDEDRRCVLVYFDFDNFKPFNDTLGFRQGDRAILLFSDLLRGTAQRHGGFVGHIGGDDFFLGLSGLTFADAADDIQALLGQFKSGAESLYDAESRNAGFISAKDRDGNPKRYPLLEASGVALHLPAGSRDCTIEEIATLIGKAKSAAKRDPTKLALVELERPAADPTGAPIGW
jgi:diguanylate cyclase (GGDEF)-like protein